MEDHQYITYETAVLAEEKGFNNPCWKLYENRKIIAGDPYDLCSSLQSKEFPLAPIQSFLQKWLREKHNIDVNVTRDSEVHYKNEIRWISMVSNWNDIKVYKTSIAEINHPNHWHYIDFKSYEEALEKGLQEALKLL